MNNIYTVGTGKVDITPPLSIPYLGLYPHRLAYFKGVHDRLYARALYLSNGNIETLIINADMIGIADALFGRNLSFIAQLKELITARTGIPGAHILLAATHAHSTPETIDFRPVAELVPEFKPWLRMFMEQIASLAKSAQQNCFSAQMRVMTTQAPGLSINRAGKSDLDNELIVLGFESKEGKKAFLVNFACHPVIMQVQPLISADYPGILANAVENAIPDTSLCLFLQGADGDINPLRGDTRNFDDVEKTGLALADRIISLFEKSKFMKEDKHPADLRVICRTESFKSCPLPDPAEIAQIERDTTDLERQIAAGNHAANITDKLALLHETLARIRQGDDDRTAFMQLIRIGNAVLFAMPFEPCCLLGKKLKQMAVPSVGIPLGYANGYLGYVSAPETGKTYETSCGPWNQIDQRAFDLILQHFAAMLV